MRDEISKLEKLLNKLSNTKNTFVWTDLVTYEATIITQLKQEFCFSVDKYLSNCKELGKTPDKPFKASLNVRTGPDLHRQAVIAVHGQSLNAFVCEAIKEKTAHC